MKRRLNILCVIVVLVLSYSVFETGYYFICLLYTSDAADEL